MRVRSPSQEDALEDEPATHSSILAWKIPWTEEPGGLQSMGSDTAEQLSLHFSWKEEDSWMWSGWENTGCNIKAVEFALWL